MNNRERVFCAAVKTIYDRCRSNGNMDFNSIVFTYAELKESFDSLKFGRVLIKNLFYKTLAGRYAKSEKIKLIVNAFHEEDLGLYRLAFPGELENYAESLLISEQGWGYLEGYDQADVETFLKKYYSWIKRHLPEKNTINGLSPAEAVWASTALLTYNAYAHGNKKEISDLFFSRSQITNLANDMCHEFAKSTYAGAVKSKAVRNIGKTGYLSLCADDKRRVSFKRETNAYAPKLDSGIKVYTVDGKKSLNAIVKVIDHIAFFLYPTNAEYEELKKLGKENDAFMRVEGCFIKRNRAELLDHALRKHCISPITYLEFQTVYNGLVREAEVTEEDFLIDEGFADAFLARKDVIYCGHKRFRYYANRGRNAGAVIIGMDLGQYKDQEISADLIRKKNQAALANAELKDSIYEVYDYLKKFAGKYCEEISFLEEREICFGKASVQGQLLGIISKYGKITKPQLINFYSEKYGASKEFVQAYLKEISYYYDDPFYRVDAEDREEIRKNAVNPGKSVLTRVREGDVKVQRNEPNASILEKLSQTYINDDSEWGVLHDRLIREFIDCDLLGQIELSDEEYVLLIKKYFIPCCRTILRELDKKPPISPLFTVAMIQVAIRAYDSNFWKRIADEIGLDSLTTMQQKKIGQIVSKTLIHCGKSFVGESEYVRNILMHAFIVDNYAPSFFEYLFQFYNLDLERSISDDCGSEADYICDALTNPNSKRQQMLSEYSGLAIYVDAEYCKRVIKASLIAIDNAFWNGAGDVKDLPDRLYRDFIKWKNNEKGDFRKAKSANTRNSESYRKFFNTPQLICRYDGDVRFSVVLPRQLLQSNGNMLRKVYWRVSTGGSVREYFCNVKDARFGQKTEEIEIAIDERFIFGESVFELTDDDYVLKRFTWHSHNLLVFDENGNHISAKNLSQGEYIGFSPLGVIVRSTAIVDTYRVSGLSYYQFMLRTGNIIFVPGEANYYVGAVKERGFSNDGLLEKAWVVGDEDDSIAVYTKIPSLVINIEDDKLGGTAIIVNDRKIKASDLEAVDIKNGSTLDQKYYCFDLSRVNGIKKGFNTVDIDVPGSSRGKKLDFVYLPDFEYSFEDAPYVNKTRGTLKINYQLTSKTCISSEIGTEDEYVDIEFANLEENTLMLQLQMPEKKYRIAFEVPLLLYSTGNGGWNFEKHEDYWYADLPRVLYLKYPAKRIKLEIKEDNGEVDSFAFDKRLDGTFECDLTKLRSYIGPFNSRKMVSVIKLTDEEKKYDFLTVINHSHLAGVELIADAENNKIIGDFDVLGKGVYFADILFDGSYICEKAPLDKNRRISIDAVITSGEYEVILFEGEDDEDSFDEINYHEVGRFNKNLRNPADITGERLSIKSLTLVRNNETVGNVALSTRYRNYIKINGKMDRHTYEGMLITAFHDKGIIETKGVRITIPDLTRTNAVLVDFTDEYGDTDYLLYDSYAEVVASPERSETYSKHERYRRFDRILWTEDDDEHYVWNVEFTEPNKAMEKTAEEWTKKNRSDDEQ